MTDDLTSFRAVIGLWRSPAAMANDIGAPPASARKWVQRNNIPAEWWSIILSTPVAAKAGLTAEDLASLAARPDLADLLQEAAPGQSLAALRSVRAR